MAEKRSKFSNLLVLKFIREIFRRCIREPWQKSCLEDSKCVWNLSNLICRKCEELVSNASEFRQRSQIMQRNWNKSIQWRVVFWSNCRHRVNRLLSSGTSLQLKLILVESGVDCLYDFYVSWHLYFSCFLFGHSTFLSLHLCLEWALHAVF